MKAPAYRVQRSDHQGIVNRAFGGRVSSWSPWRTIASYDVPSEASAHFSRISGKGLSRTRVIRGKTVLQVSR